MLLEVTPSLSTRVLPAPIAATSRVSGHARAKLEWQPQRLCGARGAATPPSGGELVPLVFEAGGRPADETVAFVRSWASQVDEAERARTIRFAWQQYSTVLQSGNAEMILSAVG